MNNFIGVNSPILDSIKKTGINLISKLSVDMSPNKIDKIKKHCFLCTRKENSSMYKTECLKCNRTSCPKHFKIYCSDCI